MVIHALIHAYRPAYVHAYIHTELHTYSCTRFASFPCPGWGPGEAAAPPDRALVGGGGLASLRTASIMGLEYWLLMWPFHMGGRDYILYRRVQYIIGSRYIIIKE